MKKREFYFPSADGKTQIHVIEWVPDKKPLAILQVAHGVTEYIDRYEAFAEYFTERGIVVVGNDHLGHGDSIAEGAEPMYFGPVGSWNWAVEDVRTLKNMTEKRYERLPYCLLGFSLGSFLVRTYLINYPGTVDASILAGTGQMPVSQISFAKMIARNEARKVGEDHTSPLVKKLTFGSYNRLFAPNRTDYDWLCASETSLDKYIADTKRGENFSTGLFRELLDGMAYSIKMENIRKMDKNTPIFFISGDKDPVGNCGKGVKRAYAACQKAGCRDVMMKLYPELRHDILHEDCHEEIQADIYQWMMKRLDIKQAGF